MASPLQRRSTAFVTAPIASLAAAAFLVVLGSLIVAARETNSTALAQQRQTLEQALRQHGLALTRELRMQTVWNEAYERTREGNQAWIRAFYGNYLNELLGYDRIYVLSGDDQLVFGFAAGHDELGATFRRIAPAFEDLVTAVRNPGSAQASYDVVVTPVALGTRPFEEHRAVADVRNVQGTPATVVVSTIVPERPVHTLEARPYLLVAIDDLDAPFMGRLGAHFAFHDLRWIDGTPEPDTSTGEVKALDGSVVGTLAWRSDQPGLEFVRGMALGVGGALALLGTLALLLMRWGRKQARRLLQSEAEALQAGQTGADPAALLGVAAHRTVAAE